MQSESPDDCSSLDQVIREADSVARDVVQAMLAPELAAIADKLDEGVTLTPDEEARIEVRVIGSTTTYLEVENSVQDRKARSTD